MNQMIMYYVQDVTHGDENHSEWLAYSLLSLLFWFYTNSTTINPVTSWLYTTCPAPSNIHCCSATSF